MFSKKSNDVKVGKKKSINIFGEEHEFDIDSEGVGVLRYNHNVNVYGITRTDFHRIIEFIDDKIGIWITRIKDYHKINELVKYSVGHWRTTMKRGDFIPYVTFNFGNEKAKELNRMLE